MPRAIFHCEPPNKTSPIRQAIALSLVGIIVGGVGWLRIDGTLTFGHIAGWLAGGMTFIVPLTWLLMRNPVMSIGIDDVGLTIVRVSRTRTFPWATIEAARFWDYPLTHGRLRIRCFEFFASGKKFELLPDFDDATQGAFEEAILSELQLREIPESSAALPGFEHTLSVSGAWIFVASIAGILAAHAMGYRTLGTVLGLGFLVTGTAIAWMTRAQRTSRLVLAATLLLIAGGAVILWACHVNVREELLKWQQIEMSR